MKRFLVRTPNCAMYCFSPERINFKTSLRRRLSGLNGVQRDIVNARGPSPALEPLPVRLVCISFAIMGKMSDSYELPHAWLKCLECTLLPRHLMGRRWWRQEGVGGVRPVRLRGLRIAISFCCLVDAGILMHSFTPAFMSHLVDVGCVLHGTEIQPGDTPDHKYGLRLSCCSACHSFCATILWTKKHLSFREPHAPSSRLLSRLFSTKASKVLE